MQVLKPKALYPSLNNTLTSGITIPSGAQQIVQYAQIYSYDNIHYKLVMRTAALQVATTNASLGFGEVLLTMPACVFRPMGSTIKTVSTLTGAAGTGGEFGMGTTISSGAVSVLGGTAAFESVMEGKTISNHVDGTQLTMKLQGNPVLQYDHGAGSVSSGVNIGGDGAIDATAGTTKIHINGASAFSAVGTFNFQAYIAFHYKILGTDFGIE